MIKKNTAVIVGLTSLTLFAGGLALINNDGNQNEVLIESFNQTPTPQFSCKVIPTAQSATKVPQPEQLYAKIPVAVPTNTPATPLSTEQPSTGTPDTIDPAQPTPPTKVEPSTKPQIPTKPKTTITRAS